MLINEEMWHVPFTRDYIQAVLNNPIVISVELLHRVLAQDMTVVHIKRNMQGGRVPQTSAELLS